MKVRRESQNVISDVRVRVRVRTTMPSDIFTVANKSNLIGSKRFMDDVIELFRKGARKDPVLQSNIEANTKGPGCPVEMSMVGS